MQAVILAGGLGTRLGPITEKIPKCMAPVGDKPFLFYLLKLLMVRGFDEVVLCTGYLGEQVSTYFGDGRGFGINIHYSQEKERLLGTGGALKLAEKLLDNNVLVINGDTYLDIDFSEIYKNFVSSHKKALIVGHPSTEGERSDLEINNSLLVTRYSKVTGEHLGYVNAGVIALKSEVISRIDPGYPVSLEKGVFPLLIAQHEMIAYITKHNFYDIGTFTGLRIFEDCVQEIRC